MICKNCGAKIGQDILLCPYCGTENSDVAKKEQQDYINDYEKKKQELPVIMLIKVLIQEILSFKE